MKPSPDIADLLAVMAALRTPQTGCPWDLQQDFDSILRYTLEEAYEVADAIARKDMVDLKDELGDLLLQVVFHARLAQEQGAFEFADVVKAITTKMIRRHPHVFGDVKDLPVERVNQIWDEVKRQEKAERRAARQALGLKEESAPSLLDEVPSTLPALTRAVKLQQKASSVGFDWNDARLVLAKIREEADELERALDQGHKQQIADETGDLLFAMVNLARHVGADPESALRSTNDKFTRRFAYIEQALQASGRQLQSASLSEMDALWTEAKRQEKSQT
ncbi:MAG: nucleoside triphosphate pyrophosphohydrolase [Alphaproteobacteria bacterium]|nr:nucleoside triphosphate pyrophosphohydrolase [Alphaproteobacteria bacterium]